MDPKVNNQLLKKKKGGGETTPEMWNWLDIWWHFKNWQWQYCYVSQKKIPRNLKIQTDIYGWKDMLSGISFK